MRQVILSRSNSEILGSCSGCSLDVCRCSSLFSYVCNEIYNAIMLRFKFEFIFRNYKFYWLWNQEVVSYLLTAVTAYHSKPYNSSYLEYFQLPRVTWPEELISCYFVSINATDFGYWTHSLNTHQDDYTTRVPAVAYHQC